MKKSIILIITVFISTYLFSQMGNYKYGLKLYKQLAYNQAVPYFEKALQEDSTNTSALHELADCYRLIGDEKNSLKYYSKVVLLDDAKPIEKYYYGQALMKNGEYEKAKPWLESFHDDSRGKNQLEGINNLPLFFKDSTQYSIKNLSDINTKYSEIGPAIVDHSLLFSSNQYRIDNINNKHNWTGKDFYKLYKTDENNFAKTIKFSNSLQTRFNVGPVCYNEKNKILYLTRNQIEDGKVIKGNDDQVKLRIYSYKYDSTKNEWTDEQSFPLNNKDYNVAHPALSKDGTWMVFSSDMPGGEGGMDLWITQNQDGKWTSPINLGPVINSKGNEVFPFISNNLLFYSSDGNEGLGGLDIYFTSLKNGKIGKINTISYPINSMGDDFGFILDKSQNIAYFCSNRPGGKGDDDIYIVNIKKSFKTTILVEGTAKDADNGKPLSNTKVTLKNENGEIISVVNTGPDGHYEFEAEPDNKYELSGTKENYISDNNKFESKTPDEGSNVIVNLNLPMNSFTLYCKIVDKKNNHPIKDVKVNIIDRNTKKQLFSFITDSEGSFKAKLEDAKLNDMLDYEVKITKEGYLGKKVDFTKKLEKPGTISMHEFIDVSLDSIGIGADLAKIIQINPIYFDLGKWNIRPDAAVELDKIVKVMKENPTMVIELGSHTDCRGSAASNLALSDKRAKSSASYIVSKGIEKNRIYGKGYGESRLVNNCACEGNIKSDCDEERHQQNRRTEFIIIKQ